MSVFGEPPPRRAYRRPDPLEWAARHPARVFLLAWIGVALVLAVWGLFSSYYTVAADEEAVILRFGRYFTTAGPGFHGRLPFGIDKVYKGRVKTVHREEFGFRTIRAGVKSEYDYRSPRVQAEANMLTGDLNLAMVNWEVRYRIRDLRKYFFEVRNPVETLRDISQAVMRTEVGDRSVDEVLTQDRTAIADAVSEKMQARLDRLRCGIQIVKVNLKGVVPPDPVREAFNQVEEAKQEKDRIINEAKGLRNEKVPAARGAAEKSIKEAEGYLIGRVNRAKGEAAAFLAVLEEYEKAPEVTRRRLYLEALEEILPKVGGITLLDGGDGGILKLLDLGRREGR